MKQLPWALLSLAVALMLWLALALVTAENQRYALFSGSCADPVFKADIDVKCVATVESREHWWQHLAYALTHLHS